MKNLMNACGILNDARRVLFADIGLLLLRVGVGTIMATSHGWGKLSTFSEQAASFPDPLGVGSQLSLTLAVGAEFFCSIALVLGLCTRLASIPLIVTMLVAACIIHGDDPWAKKELAVMFLIPFTVLLLTGPGRFSLDCLLCRKCCSE